MGPWLVLVSPCFWENVVATCKIGPFLCSLDNLLQENGLFLTYFSHILVTREKLQKILQHISHSHAYTYFAHAIDCFCLQILKKKKKKKKTRIYQVRFLFGMSPGFDSYSRHFGNFGTINK